MSDDEEMFGPPLPPNLRPSTNGDQPPAKKIIGPVIPASSSSKLDTDTGTEDSDSSSSDSEPDTQSKKVIGPVGPSDCGQPSRHDDTDQAAGIGPSLPPGYVKQSGNESDVDESIGPRPPGPDQEGQVLTAAEEFEERARKMKQKLIHGVDDSSKPVARESWMTELPSVGITKHMGLVARKLGDGCKVKDEDQSIWTDTPSERERKAKEGYSDKGKKRKYKDPVLSTRDKHMAEQVEAYNKEKRAQSLLELHQKKLKKKSKEKKKKEKKKKKKSDRKIDEVKPRRPFDRDSDLNVNRFDDAKRKLLIKRSQELNSRFGHGGQQFL